MLARFLQHRNKSCIEIFVEWLTEKKLSSDNLSTFSYKLLFIFLEKKLATVSCIPLTVTYSSADDLKLYNAAKTTNQHEALKNNLGTVWRSK